MQSTNHQPHHNESSSTPAAPKLLERLRQALRERQLAPTQVEQLARCVAAFIGYHGLRHPAELGPEHVTAFLIHLRRNPDITPQREAAARAALTFLYEEFLPQDDHSPRQAAHSQPDLPAPTALPRNSEPPPSAPAGRTASPFLNRCHELLRLRHYSLRTEECYVNWIKRFILFHGKRHPSAMGAPEIEAFLTHLAVESQVSASTQKQAFLALLFLYRQVLERELPRLDAVRAKRPERLPVVMSRPEVRQVLEAIEGAEGLVQLAARVQYGCGLRVLESCRVRVHDVELGRGQVLVRDGKGGKDRIVKLPRSLWEPLTEQIAQRRQLHLRDLQRGQVWVWLPMRWPASTPTRPANWAGNFCFPRVSARATRARATCVVTTSTRAPWHAPSPRPSARPDSSNTSPVTPFATALPPTCWKIVLLWHSAWAGAG